MIKFKKLIEKFNWPKYGLFGFEILNYWHSILFAYILIVSELLIVPFFGYEQIQVMAGIYFVLLINLSIIILFVNSLIKINRFDLNILILNIPLYIFIPFSLHKVINHILFLKSVYL